MNRVNITKKSIVTVLAVVITLAFLFSVEAGDQKKGHAEKKGEFFKKLHSQQLPQVLQSLDNAIKAVEADDRAAALEQLKQAKALVAGINEQIGEKIQMHSKPGIANIKCPIMGAPIDPSKVTESLTREYKGQNVAFCCGGCPSTWDKLSDEQKEAKLAKVKIEPKEDHSDHKH